MSSLNKDTAAVYRRQTNYGNLLPSNKKGFLAKFNFDKTVTFNENWAGDLKAKRNEFLDLQNESSPYTFCALTEHLDNIKFQLSKISAEKKNHEKNRNLGGEGCQVRGLHLSPPSEELPCLHHTWSNPSTLDDRMPNTGGTALQM